MSFAPGIRAKVLLASSTLLLIPWIGYAFVAEMERFLRDGQARMLADSARAVAALVQERSHVAAGTVRARRDVAPALRQPIVLDGAIEDWTAQGVEVRSYGGERLAEVHGPWTPEPLSFSHAVERFGEHVYAFFDVNDDRVVYCADASQSCDQVRVSMQAAGRELQRFIVSTPQPGPVIAVPQGSGAPSAKHTISTRSSRGAPKGTGLRTPHAKFATAARIRRCA